MFSQRKRFYEKKSFYGLILVLLLAFGIWMNSDFAIRQGEGESQEPVVHTGEQIPNDTEKKNGTTLPDSSSSNAEGYGDDGTAQGSGAFQNGLYGDGENQEAGFSNSGEVENDSELAGLEGPCYLVKEDSGFIKIYSVGEDGKRQLIRTTDISFSLLSENDQKLFQQGIVKETQDELLDLLQDFES